MPADGKENRRRGANCSTQGRRAQGLLDSKGEKEVASGPKYEDKELTVIDFHGTSEEPRIVSWFC